MEGKICYGEECKIYKFSYLHVSIKHTKMIFILDSLATDSKPSAETAMEKMWMLLCMEDGSLDVAKWGFYTAEYIPQVYRGRFGRKHRFHRVRYFQLFVLITTVPTEE